MRQQKRSAPQGWIYHALNRAIARKPIFTKDEDFIGFVLCLRKLLARI